MSGKRHFFEKRRDGSSLATFMKTVTGLTHRVSMRNQSCGFEMAIPVAVRAPEALAIGGKFAEPSLSQAYQRFSTDSVSAEFVLSRTVYH